jgi:hypothetical protein
LRKKKVNLEKKNVKPKKREKMWENKGKKNKYKTKK